LIQNTRFLFLPPNSFLGNHIKKNEQSSSNTA
jgi:hypothetical protein